MEQLALSIPSLWADHHVLAVRDVLCSLAGVEHVDASALERLVTVTFDPTATSGERLVESLAAGGYAAAADAAGEDEQPIEQPSPWGECGSRVTVTNPVDLAMSGDYRKY